MARGLKTFFLCCILSFGVSVSAFQGLKPPALKEKMNEILEQVENSRNDSVEDLFSNLVRIQNSLSYELVMLNDEARENTEESPPDHSAMLTGSRGFSKVMEPLMSAFNKIASKQETLSPFEQHVVNLMEGKRNPYSKGTEAFIHEKGRAAELDKSSVKLLTLNTCFLPGGLPKLNGGVEPWRARFSPLVKFIKESNADVVCLQEMFNPDATDALRQFLSDDYAHFYVHIAPKVLSKKMSNTFGFGSGLLVMSKMPIKNAQYVPIKAEHPCVNRGVFMVDVVRKDSKPLRIGNTHLVAFHNDEAKQIRQEQIKEVTKILSKSKYQTILCGDFNISLGSGEPAEDTLKEFYLPTYSNGPTYCDYTKYWKSPDEFEPK